MQKLQQRAQSDSLPGKYRYMPSGPAASPGMQRALFVLQVIEGKDASAQAGKAATAVAAPADASLPNAAKTDQKPANSLPNESTPANAAPTDAERKQ